MIPMKTYLSTAVVALLLSACSSDSPVEVAGPDNLASRALTPIGSAEDFYEALKTGLKAQASYYGTSNVVFEESAVDTAADSDSSTTSDGAASSENETTSTNVQEQGVDEQDWVKLAASGDELYVLNSEYFYDYEGVPELVDEGPTFSGRSSIAIPQSYRSELRILNLDAQTPDSSSAIDFELDLSGRYAQGFYLYESGDAASVYVTASGNNYWEYWGSSTAFSGADSLITQVDVSNPAAPSISASFEFDGQIVSSRRIGSHLFFVSRYYPTLEGIEPWTQSSADWAAQVDSTDLSTVMPMYYRNGDTAGTAMVDPSSCFVADSGSDSSYYSPDIITLGVIDLDTMDMSDSVCFLGATETLYASANAVFLATTQYDYSSGPIAEDGREIDVESDELPVDIAWYDPRVNTDIHQFDIDSGQLSYEGSGKVNGHLGWNALRKPFRMSEKDGYLRVATMNDQQGGDNSPILMTVLKSDGQGSLQTVSTLPSDNSPTLIGKPGEQLYASRFVGDRAYLVTFRQTDPLYVIDLADPTNPSTAGELEIEGYSDYLQPIGENHLLGIGRDAYAAEEFFNGALVLGVKLSLFDVSNPAEPTEIQSVLVGQRGTSSNALNDHRAITIQAATDAHPMRLSFGIDVHGASDAEHPSSIEEASNWYGYSFSGLHGFDIQVGADAQIIPRGVLRVDSTDGYGYGQDRSVMVNDALFYIKDAKVYAAHWDDLANASPAR